MTIFQSSAYKSLAYSDQQLAIKEHLIIQMYLILLVLSQDAELLKHYVDANIIIVM